MIVNGREKEEAKKQEGVGETWLRLPTWMWERGAGKKRTEGNEEKEKEKGKEGQDRCCRRAPVIIGCKMLDDGDGFDSREKRVLFFLPLREVCACISRDIIQPYIIPLPDPPANPRPYS